MAKILHAVPVKMQGKSFKRHDAMAPRKGKLPPGDHRRVVKRGM